MKKENKMSEIMKNVSENIKNIKNFFEEIGWDFKLVILVIFALGFDIFGFKMMFEEKNNKLNGDWFYYIYDSIRLFLFDLQTPALDTSLPLFLKIGSILSGIATIWVVLLVFTNIFKARWKLYRKGKNHIIIVGAGDKGKTLGLDWLKKTKDKSHKDYGKLIVFIEKDKNNPNVDILRENGAVIVFGDAKDKKILQKVKIEKADYLVTFTDSDVTNMEIISAIATMQNIEDKISCYVHLIHNEFYEFFRTKKFNEDSKLDIKVFSIYANAARMLFGDENHLLGFNVFTDAKKIKDKNTKVKIAIFGFGQLGESILINALQLGYFYNENPIEITVVYDQDKNENRLDEFIKQYNIGIKKGEKFNRDFQDYWKIKFIDDGEFVEENISEYSQIIIAYENEFESLSNLMKLFKRHINELSNNIDIAVYTSTLVNISKIIQNDKVIFKHVRTFGDISDTCSYDIVVNEKLDKKAMLNDEYYNKLHGNCVKVKDSNLKEKNMSEEEKKKYCKEHYGNEKCCKKNKNGEIDYFKWNELSMFLKDSNRYLVEHNKIKKYIINKLIESSTVNNDYEKLKKFIKEKFYNYKNMEIKWDKMGLKNHKYIKKLSKEDIEQLAKIEHKRWCAFHILNGWKPMSIDELKNRTKGLKDREVKRKKRKDEVKKLHACLVSWEELDKVSEILEYNYKSHDIETIMRIPKIEEENLLVKDEK
jgi:hypothetical protein